MQISVVDTNVTKFGKRNDVSYRELLAEAALPILQRGIIPPKKIEGLIISAGQPELLVNQAHVANMATEVLGLNPKYVSRTEMACSSGGVATRQGIALLQSGLLDNVLIVGLEKMNENVKMATKGLCMVPDVLYESSQGQTAYSGFALFARAHMQKYGTTREQLAEVSVKNHLFAEQNPKAHFHKAKFLPVTIEKVVNAPILAEPLTRLDASPISDGAAAILLSRPEKLQNKPEIPVSIIASAQRTAPSFSMSSVDDLTSFYVLKQVAQEAYAMAGIKPSDVRVAETHDCFTIAEIMEYEALGFCKEGEGGTFIEEKQSYPDGNVCVNPSGGLKAKGHPIGATGVAQIVSITEQLRGMAEGVQVDHAEIGLTQNLSGFATNHVVHILKRMD